MIVDVQAEKVVAIILVATRMGVLFLMTPLDALGRLPARIRVLFVLALSVFLVTVLGVMIEMPLLSGFRLVTAMINEALLGLVLVFGIYSAMAVFHLGGKLLDFQSGFGAAAILNPVTSQQDPLWGTVFTVFSLFIFYASNMHLLVVRGLAYTIQHVPLGGGLVDIPLQLLVEQFGSMFVWGLVLVAPAVIVLLLVDVAVGVMSRTMPQMNVYFVMLPLKIFLAMLVVVLSLAYLVPLVGEVFHSVFSSWEVMLDE